MPLEYTTITQISGPLVVVDQVREVHYDELVEIETRDGEIRRGRVLEASAGRALVQVFEGTSGLDVTGSRVQFLGKVLEIPVSPDILGRVFDGAGNPIDDGPKIIPEKRLDINGSPINPFARSYPSEFIQTGISGIDCMNPLSADRLPISRAQACPTLRSRLRSPGRRPFCQVPSLSLSCLAPWESRSRRPITSYPTSAERVPSTGQSCS